jgi:hypothetical protein
LTVAWGSAGSKAAMASATDTTLPQPLAARIRAEAERACLLSPAFSALFPEVQLATLGDLASRADGIYHNYGSERVLSIFGRWLRKPVVSLETPELHARALRIENHQDRLAILEKLLGQLESNRILMTPGASGI